MSEIILVKTTTFTCDGCIFAEKDSIVCNRPKDVKECADNESVNFIYVYKDKE